MKRTTSPASLFPLMFCPETSSDCIPRVPSIMEYDCHSTAPKVGFEIRKGCEDKDSIAVPLALRGRKIHAVQKTTNWALKSRWSVTAAVEISLQQRGLERGLQCAVRCDEKKGEMRQATMELKVRSRGRPPPNVQTLTCHHLAVARTW